MDSVRLLAVETALPTHRFDQATARSMARDLFARRIEGYDRLESVFAGSSVEQRWLVKEPAWYLTNTGWAARMAAYLDTALDLLEQVAVRTLRAAGISPDQIDHVVTVSTTGIATPSLDAHLLERLGLRPTVSRTPVFGWGCAGGVLGLGRAGALARAAPGSLVLLLAVETCSLAFRPDPDPVTVVGLSLFGDGAAGAVLRVGDDGVGPSLLASGEHCWPDTKALMGWRVEDPGLGLELGRSLPAFVLDALPPVVDRFLEPHGMGLGELSGVVLHPGGPKVIDAVRDGLGLTESAITPARSVLRSVGNLSSVTVFFVLREQLHAGLGGPVLLTALGPGFTAGFVLLEGA